MKIVLLGSAGFIPTWGKETMSVLVVSDNNNAFLFDAGTGVKNLRDQALSGLLHNVSTLNVMLSHLHHDHIAGLTWLLRLWKGKLNIYAPSVPLVEFDGVKSLCTLTSNPFFGLPIHNWPNVSSIIPMQGNELEVNGDLIQIIGQEHTSGSIGFRIAKFAYITDTSPGNSHADFLVDCEMVLMDTMHCMKDYEEIYKDSLPQHGSSIGNARIAKDANLGKLYLIHLDPLYGDSEVQQLLNEARSIFPESHIPLEMKQYEI